MKKTRQFYLTILIFAFLLSACVVQGVANSRDEFNEVESINAPGDKNAILQQLSQLMEDINDDTQEHNIREKASKDFVELLQSTIEDYDLSDQELSDLKLNVFVCEKQESMRDDMYLRFIVYMGYPEIFGTLERTWTFVEIHRGIEKYTQIIYEKTSETPTKCQWIQANGRDYVLLYGGTTVYTPRPLFISFWELSEIELIPTKLINHTDKIEDNVKEYENMLIFEGGQEQWYFDAAMTDLSDNPLLLVKLGLKEEIAISFENESFVAQKRK